MLFHSFYSFGKKEFIPVIFMILLILAVYFVGFLSPMRGDAVRYASISREMLKTGEFIELHNRGGVPYLQKPPLLFWITCLSFSISGISNMAFKLPVFLVSLLGACFTYRYSDPSSTIMTSIRTLF
ncbi:MAG: hypothetical protein PVF73_08225 [Bacteroidales bacterium]|jgi:4-amino-4-deoxy-L-arabinose transferase-like glycosyltransferase